MSDPNTHQKPDAARRRPSPENRRLQTQAAHLGVPKFMLRLAGWRRLKHAAPDPAPRHRHD